MDVRRSTGIGVVAFATLALSAIAMPATAVEVDEPLAATSGPELAATAQELLTVDDAVQAIAPDGSGNVVVSVSDDDLAPDTLEYVEGHANVVIEDIGGPITTRAANELVGGAGYVFDLGGTYAACSAGFSGWTPDGQDAVITAGHCAEGQTGLSALLTRPSEEPAVGGPGAAVMGPLGSLGFAQFGQPGNPSGAEGALDSVDVAAINVDPVAGLELLPRVTDWTTAAQDDLAASSAPIARIGQASDGMAITKSGRTTGVTSGTVTGGLGWAAIRDGSGQSHVVHGFMAEMTVASGDSGAPVYSGDTAVGVVSGGNDAGTLTWVADLGNALAHTGGYSIKLDLTEPAITSPADLTRVGAGSTIAGTAHPGTTLTLEDAATGTRAVQEVPVGDHGSWSATAPSAPGAYTLRASVRDDGYNVSDTVEFDISVVPAAPVIAQPAADSVANAPFSGVSGSASPNATVRLTIDGVPHEAQAGAEGAWSVSDVDFGWGDHEIVATQVVDGVESAASTVAFRVVPAAPVITDPSNGQHIDVADAPRAISGTGLDGATVRVEAGGQVVTTVVSGGAWTVQLPAALTAGAQRIAATQTIDGVTSHATVIQIQVVEPAPAVVDPAPTDGEPVASAPAPRGSDAGRDELATTGADVQTPLTWGLALIALAIPLLALGAVRSRRP